MTQPNEYSPTGHGICSNCGQDVGRHDDGHEFVSRFGDFAPDYCKRCRNGQEFNDPHIHDVGRVLRCPEVDEHE